MEAARSCTRGGLTDTAKPSWQIQLSGLALASSFGISTWPAIIISYTWNRSVSYRANLRSHTHELFCKPTGIQ